MTSYLAVTTCAAAQWLAYGRAMVNTFVRHWPIPLRLYTEGFHCDVEGVEAVELADAAPWLGPWKSARSKAERGYRTGKYRFRDDAVRFSHKVATIGAAAGVATNGAGETPDKSSNMSTDSPIPDVLIWLDADTVTHSPVTLDWLAELFPPDAAVAWLDRERVYPECGVLMFRLPSARRVIRQIVSTYQTGAIFKLREWHDSYVIETVVKSAEAMGEVRVASLSGEGRKSHHPLCNSRLAEALDHLKGSRKLRGRSKRDDLMKPRSEPYWQF